MAMTGRCYCGAVRYEADGPPTFKGKSHCRGCQYISGGAWRLMPEDVPQFPGFPGR